MLKYTKGIDYAQFDHMLFVGLVQAQFPGAAVNSEGDNPALGTPGFVTVDLSGADGPAVLAILTTALSAAIAAQQLAQVQAQVCTEINASCLAVMYGVFTDLSGNTWQVDQNSRARIFETETKLANGMTLPAGFTWRTTNNVEVPMNAAEFTALTQAIWQWDQDLKTARTTEKAAVRAMTLAQVQAYVIPAWPTW